MATRSMGFIKTGTGLPQTAVTNLPEADGPKDIINFTPVMDGYTELLNLPSGAAGERKQRLASLMERVGEQNGDWTESAFYKIHASYPWIDTLMVDRYGKTVVLADAHGFQFRGFWGAPVQYDDVRRPPTSEELVTMINQLQVPLYLITYPLDTQLYIPHNVFPDVKRAFEKGLRSRKHGRVPHKIYGKEGQELSNAILDELRLIETEIDGTPFKQETFAKIQNGEDYRQVDIVRINSGVLGSLQGELQKEFAIGKIVLKDIGQKVKDREGLGFKPAGAGTSREPEPVGYYPRVYLGEHPAMPYIELPGHGRRRQPVYITPFSEADELLSGKVPTSTGERAYVIYANPQSNLAVDALLAYGGDGVLNSTPLILTHTIDRRWTSR
ncbi:MAG: hypothetical protein HY365_01965 [Candidatus Aenigmarchaeota archaeon]|nr:hypothetical protein [Candidatus Aenigmarchaeota archaeon]